MLRENERVETGEILLFGGSCPCWSCFVLEKWKPRTNKGTVLFTYLLYDFMSGILE
jgi:hypothetical protein